MRVAPAATLVGVLTLALDVDGVLLDSGRGGEGHWSRELQARFDIDPAGLSEAFFGPFWGDVVTGKTSIEEPLAQALAELGSEVGVEEVLACWFEADYVPLEPSLDLARRIAEHGHRLVLATNQEHRRASYLQKRIGAVVPLAHVFYSAALGHQKNDQQFFALASQELGLHTSELANVVFVDDTVANVEIAQSFGWHAIHALKDGAWREEVDRLFGL